MHLPVPLGHQSRISSPSAASGGLHHRMCEGSEAGNAQALLHHPFGVANIKIGVMRADVGMMHVLCANIGFLCIGNASWHRTYAYLPLLSSVSCQLSSERTAICLHFAMLAVTHSARRREHHDDTWTSI